MTGRFLREPLSVFIAGIQQRHGFRPVARAEAFL